MRCLRRVARARLAPQVHRDPWDPLDRLDRLDRLETRDPLDLPGLKEPRGSQDHKVPVDPWVPPDSKVHEGSRFAVPGPHPHLTCETMLCIT